MLNISVISFLVVALVYASIAAFSKVFYQKKSIANLSQSERNILFDRATKNDRFVLFITNLLSSFIAPPVYILAILLAVFIYLITKI